MERKLRPIYEAIDARNFKQALRLSTQAAEKAKGPDLLLVHALKALSLERLGKPDEATTLCDEIFKTSPIDEGILQILTPTLRNLGKGSESTAAYEKAWEKRPSDEALAIGYFHGLVREQVYSKQQQVAMKLFKQFNRPKYYYWAVISLVNQVDSGAPAMLLDLAQRMMDKMITDNKLAEYEELWLYLDILRRKGMHADGLKVLAGPLGGLCKILVDRLRAALPFAIAAGLTADVIIISRALLNHFSDDWAILLHYITAVCAGVTTPVSNDCTVLLTACNEPVSAQVDDVAAARVFLKDLQTRAQAEAGVTRRGPFLAEIELESRAGAVEDILAPLLVQYTKLFASRPCCAEDVLPYVRKLTAANSAEVAKAALDAAATGADAVLRKVTMYKVQRAANLLQSDEQAANALFDEYLACIDPAEKLASSERRACDDLALVCAHVLLDRYRDTGRQQLLFDAVHVLEFAFEKSPKNFQYALQLIDCYIQLGAWQAADNLWQFLSVKHIQFDTLSYRVLQPALRLFGFDFAGSLCEDIIQFHFDYHQREAGDYIVAAYRWGSYSKVTEFVQLAETLGSSHMLASAYVEQALLHVLRKPVVGAQPLKALSFVGPRIVNGTTTDNADSPDLKWTPSGRDDSVTPLVGTSASSADATIPLAHRQALLQIRGALARTLHAVHSKQAPDDGELRIARSAAQVLGVQAVTDVVSNRNSDPTSVTQRSVAAVICLIETSALLYMVSTAAAGSDVSTLSNAVEERFKLLQQLLATEAGLADAALQATAGGAVSALSITSTASFAELFGWLVAVLPTWATWVPKVRKPKKGEPPITAGSELRDTLRSLLTTVQSTVKPISAHCSARKKPVDDAAAVGMGECCIAALREKGAKVRSEVIAKVAASHGLSFARAFTLFRDAGLAIAPIKL
eukprot:TRINITY_DN4390_c0_g1_i1.p1 TRINITY_DN4390_c0_g1~~TRINITY_DN4390_c0_g1_i1.p1  ORF type:complete len:915 (+),score=248.43 TRINITY_DN4390_c0_g1_i1:97-2841(+)